MIEHNMIEHRILCVTLQYLYFRNMLKFIIFTYYLPIIMITVKISFIRNKGIDRYRYVRCDVLNIF